MHSGEFSSVFCVVCGRFDRELLVRRSGLKCIECVGKRSKKEYAALQAQHASYMLSREHNMTLTLSGSRSGAAGSPLGATRTIDGGGAKRPSLDLTQTLGLSSPYAPLVATAQADPSRSPQVDTTLSMGQQVYRGAPAGAALMQHRAKSPVAPHHIANFNLDDLSVEVTEPRTEEVDASWSLLHHTETATTYCFIVRERSSGTEIAVTRHRFRDAFRVFSLVKEVGGAQLPELPEKKILNRFDPSFVETRRAEMEEFVRAAVQSPFFVRHPQLLGFLGVEMLVREQQLRAQGPIGVGCAVRGPAELPVEELRQCKRGTLLGRGTFGAVFLGLLPSSSQLVAVKVIRIASVHEGEIEKLQRELNLLRNLDHLNIVRFLGAFYDNSVKELCIFTEYIECGSVANMVRRFGALPMPVIQKYMRQICEGLAYLHGLDVVHRDIKGDNILVTKDGSVKLADFGCSGTLSQFSISGETAAGTPQWMAPEVMRGDTSSGPASDIWSLGCVGIEMLQRRIWNIDDRENIFSSMYKISQLSCPPHGLPPEGSISAEFRRFLVLCLQREMQQRPTAVELLEHPFFTIDYAMLDADVEIPACPRPTPVASTAAPGLKVAGDTGT